MLHKNPVFGVFFSILHPDAHRAGVQHQPGDGGALAEAQQSSAGAGEGGQHGAEDLPRPDSRNAGAEVAPTPECEWQWRDVCDLDEILAERGVPMEANDT